jgi:branched-chain amino acid transport system substrate-binding protein
VIVSPNLRNGKFLSIILGIVMVLGGLSACAQNSNNNGTTTTQNQGPIKIGFATSMTGDFSADGKLLLQGYQFWADEINKQGGLLGRQVVLDYLDDKSDPNTATVVYQTLIRDHHDDLIIGPFGFSNVSAGRIADRYGYALVEGAGTTPDTFQANIKNLFSVSLSTENYMVSFAQYILSIPLAQRPKTAAYTLVDDPLAGPTVMKAHDILTQGGVQQVYSKTYADETVNFQPIAAAIAAANPDVVILGTESPQAAAAYIKAFKQQHFNPKAIIGLSGPDAGDQFTSLIGGTQVAEGIFVPNDGWWPTSPAYQNAQFVKDFVAKFGGTPDGISSDSVQAYSAGQVLQQAVEKANSVSNAKLLNVLHDTNNTWNTIQGPVKFGSDGQNIASIAYLFQWQNGQLIPVYPSGQALQNPEFPKKSWP